MMRHHHLRLPPRTHARTHTRTRARARAHTHTRDQGAGGGGRQSMSKEREAATNAYTLACHTTRHTHTHHTANTHTLYKPHGTHTHSIRYKGYTLANHTTYPCIHLANHATRHTHTHHALQGAQPVAGEAPVRGSELSWPLWRVWLKKPIIIPLRVCLTEAITHYLKPDIPSLYFCMV